MSEMLDLYKNIKERRIELDMSQQELAEAVGYKGKSMISQVEKGMVDLPESMIIKFADALYTTPATLMGWENVKIDPVSGYPVSPEEETPDYVMQDGAVIERQEAKRLYDLYTQAPPEIQAAVETLLKATKPDS